MRWKSYKCIIVISTIDFITQLQNVADMTDFTPSYKKTIPESKQPVSGIDFFFRFSPRLSENDYSRVKFIAKFVPTASNLSYFGLNCCFSEKSVVRGHERVGFERELLIFLEKHSNLAQNNAKFKLQGQILQ